MKLKKLIVLLLALAMMCTGMASAESSGTLELPADLTIIEERAFYGTTDATNVILPEGVVEIHSYAFADSSITSVNLPSSLTYIADDAFYGCEGLTVSAEEGSYAYEWAVANGYALSASGVTYRALLIGNTYPGSDSELPGPDNDAYAMRTMLAMQSGTPYSTSVTINTTASGMKSAITSAFGEADSNDVSLFFYSGHGTSAGSLCGVDDTYLSVSQLRAHLDTIPGTKIVLLDCCYSGAHINKSSTGFNEAVIAAFSARTRSNLATDNYI